MFIGVKKVFERLKHLSLDFFQSISLLDFEIVVLASESYLKLKVGSSWMD